MEQERGIILQENIDITKLFPKIGKIKVTIIKSQEMNVSAKKRFCVFLQLFCCFPYGVPIYTNWSTQIRIIRWLLRLGTLDIFVFISNPICLSFQTQSRLTKIHDSVRAQTDVTKAPRQHKERHPEEIISMPRSNPDRLRFGHQIPLQFYLGIACNFSCHHMSLWE